MANYKVKDLKKYTKHAYKMAEMVAGGQFVIPDSSGSTIRVG